MLHRPNTHHSLVPEGLEVLELPLGCVLSLGVGLVEDLGRADPAAVVDVAGHAEATLEQLGHEVNLLGSLALHLQRLGLHVVGQPGLLRIQVDVFAGLENENDIVILKGFPAICTCVNVSSMIT